MFDDPLSAVDSHVGKCIFDSVLGPQGLLKSKTRLVVTNSLSFLPQFDQILMFDGGQIREMGSYEDLVKQNGLFTDFVNTFMNSNQSILYIIKIIH
jgi:ABC-type multidrug transport system fused ATPase/permease subunit